MRSRFERGVLLALLLLLALGTSLTFDVIPWFGPLLAVLFLASFVLLLRRRPSLPTERPAGRQMVAMGVTFIVIAVVCGLAEGGIGLAIAEAVGAGIGWLTIVLLRRAMRPEPTDAAD